MRWTPQVLDNVLRLCLNMEDNLVQHQRMTQPRNSNLVKASSLQHCTRMLVYAWLQTLISSRWTVAVGVSRNQRSPHPASNGVSSWLMKLPAIRVRKNWLHNWNAHGTRSEYRHSRFEG
jgi:hypothetical protein